MKLIYAIVHAEDGNAVTEELTKHRFSVTKLATTGGFLRRGNTTLLIGTEDQFVNQVIEIIKQECGQRKQITYGKLHSHTSSCRCWWGYNLCDQCRTVRKNMKKVPQNI